MGNPPAAALALAQGEMWASVAQTLAPKFSRPLHTLMRQTHLVVLKHVGTEFYDESQTMSKDRQAVLDAPQRQH